MQQQVACNATKDFVTFFATLSNENLKLERLGNWVKKHREKMNFSQETAAEKVGLSRYQWIRIENGQSGTKRETILNIARELNADEVEGLTLLAGLEPSGAGQNVFADMSLKFGGLPSTKQEKAELLIQALDRILDELGEEKEGNVNG